MIPYVISEAHPDYRSPYLKQDFGIVKESEMKTYFLDNICNFILQITSEINSSLDVEIFFQSFYADSCCMFNSPWDAMVFRNNEWENANPSYESIWEHIKLLKTHKS